MNYSQPIDSFFVHDNAVSFLTERQKTISFTPITKEFINTDERWYLVKNSIVTKIHYNLGTVQQLRNPFMGQFSLGTPLSHCIIFWVTTGVVIPKLCNS